VSIPKKEVTADATQLSLEPGQTVTCNLAFTPTTVGKFNCPVTFEVNGVYKTSAEVVADVIARRVETVNSSDRILDLGALRTGKSRKYSVELVNKALLEAEIDLAPAKELARKLGLHLRFDHARLATREKKMLTITYKPKTRLPSFNEAIKIGVSNVLVPILRVKGSALGLQAKLSAETMPFGNVILGSSTTKPLQLLNLGALQLACENM
jgi:hydrocephalus-inducing protein